jgi:hypothetical protein
MSHAITRRAFVGQSLVWSAGLAGARVEAAGGKGPQIYGTGRIGPNLPGKTIPSPSDFGFAGDPDGGSFVCSMYGPQTGGFKGCNLMTVEGIITPGSVQAFKRTATFSGKVSVFVFPDVFSGGPYLNLGDLDMTVTLELGGPGKASMILHIPAVAGALGGDTGGIVQFGRIDRKRIRA